MDDKKKEEYFNKVYNNIKNNGYHTTAVLEEVDFTPFAYSTEYLKTLRYRSFLSQDLGRIYLEN